ncbi:MAG: hypothetical protein JOZ35_21125 [Hyphomicrobiales bacterium]|nr:hypothetical protein [Hyphomicrobiales bacterium]MBV8289424.1 hypothetical protein [Hyphomicrobiales bacterium]MBV8319191.1 hypothetical protein [Hyphomicrobiales bacterium]
MAQRWYRRIELTVVIGGIAGINLRVASANSVAIEPKAGIKMFDASTGQDQLDQSHLRDIDIHENRGGRLPAFNHVENRLTVRNKKSVSPGPRQ